MTASAPAGAPAPLPAPPAHPTRLVYFGSPDLAVGPFDASLTLYQKGHLASVQDLEGLKNFNDIAKAGWSTDDGKTTYCMPMASVIHGFLYNKEHGTATGPVM